VDALASGGEEGRRSLRNAPSSWQASDDTGMSEWGNPVRVMPDYPPSTRGVGPTRGTETSQYPQERKSNETPVVAASEPGRAQTIPVQACRRCWNGVVRLAGQGCIPGAE